MFKLCTEINEMLVFASKSLTSQWRISWHVISDLLKLWLALGYKRCLLTLSILFAVHKSSDYLFVEKEIEIWDKQGEWSYMRILSTYINIVRRVGMVANAFSKKSCISYTRIVCVLLLYTLCWLELDCQWGPIWLEDQVKFCQARKFCS